MPTTTFSANSTTSGDEQLTVTVSGITGTVTGIDYEVDFTAMNGSGVQCEMDSDPDGNYQEIFGTGDMSAGGSPYSVSYSADTIPSTINGDYEFSISDAFFGSSGLNLSQIRVVVETGSSGTNYSIDLDDVKSSSESSETDISVTSAPAIDLEIDSVKAAIQCQQVNISVTYAESVEIPVLGSESESEGQRAGISLARPAAKSLAIDSVDSHTQALPAQVRVGGPFRPEDLRSISETQTFYLYNTRSVTRTVNFW